MIFRVVNRYWAGKIRMIWVMLAMIPVVAVSGLLALSVLVLCAPLMLYAGLTGKHLKDPEGRAFDPMKPARIEVFSGNP